MTTKLPNGYEAVVVPDGATEFFFWNEKLCTNETYSGIFIKPIPGNYTIIAKASEIKEEQAREIVEGYGIDNGWRNYLVGSQYEELLKKTALESFHSLLKSKNLEAEATLIIKKTE